MTSCLFEVIFIPLFPSSGPVKQQTFSPCLVFYKTIFFYILFAHIIFRILLIFLWKITVFWSRFVNYNQSLFSVFVKKKSFWDFFLKNKKSRKHELCKNSHFWRLFCGFVLNHCIKITKFAWLINLCKNLSYFDRFLWVCSGMNTLLYLKISLIKDISLRTNP